MQTFNEHSTASELNEHIMDEEAYANMPPFNIYTGANSEKKETLYGDLSYDKDIIYPSNKMASFFRKSAQIRNYFSDVEQRKANLSYQVLAILSDSQDKTMVAHLDELKRAKSNDEVNAVLTKMMYGEKDTKRRALLNTLSKIEDESQFVVDEYREIAKKQNPLFTQMHKKEKLLANKGIHSFYHHRIKLFDIGDDDIEAQRQQELEIRQLEQDYPLSQVLTDLHKFKQNEHNAVSDNFKKHFMSYYESLGSGFMKAVESDITMIEERQLLDTLGKKHEEAQKLAQEIVIRSFQSKGSPNLEEVMYGESAAGILPTEKHLNITSSRMRKSLERALDGMDKTLLTKEMRDTILTDIVDKFSGRTDEMKDAIKAIDLRYELAIEKGVPPDARLEEEFQKLLEDSIYNEIMKHNGGTDIYLDNRINGKTSGNKNIINVIENSQNGAYLPLGKAGTKSSKLVDSAIGLHNISTLFDKISKKDITKVEAREVINKSIPFLDLNEKQSLESGLNEFYENKKLTELDLGMGDKKSREYKSPSVMASDFIVQSNTKQFYKNRYENGMGDRMLNALGVHRKSALTYHACLQKSESPMIQHHSTASETTQCSEQYAKALEQDKDKYMNTLNSPLSVMLPGLPGILVILIALKQMRRTEAYMLNVMNELMRAKTLKFIRDSQDIIEEEFRLKALVADRDGLSEGIVDKEQYGEYIYRSLKAHHDLNEEYNPYLQHHGGSLLDTIRKAGTENENAQSTRKVIRSILDGRQGLRSSFNKELANYTDKLSLEYDEKLSIVSHALSIASTSDEKIEALEKMLYVVSDGYKKGSKDIFVITETSQQMDAHLASVLAQVNKDLAAIQSALKKIAEEITLAEKNNDAEAKSRLFLESSRLRDELALQERRSQRVSSLIRDNGDFAMELDALLDSTQSLIKEKYGTATLSNEGMKKLVKDALSQMTSYGDDEEKAINSFEMRYTGKNAENALFQDLNFVENLIAIKKKDGFSSENELKALIALKVSMRESYLSAKTINDGDLGREKAFENLFRTHNKEMISTADISLRTIEQEDGQKLQIVSLDKTKTETDPIDEALAIISNPNISNAEKAESINFVERYTGIEASSDRYLKKTRQTPVVDEALTMVDVRRDKMNMRIDGERKKEHKGLPEEKGTSTSMFSEILSALTKDSPSDDLMQQFDTTRKR